MAKRGRKMLNRSQAIRDYKTAHPSAKPKEIVAALKAKGISVSAGLVAAVQHGMKNKATGASGKPKHGTRTLRGRRGVRGTSGLSAEDLLEAKRLVDELGGLDEARAALDLLTEMA